MQTVRFLLLNGSMLCGYLLKGKEAYLPIRYLEILIFITRPHGVMCKKYLKISQEKTNTNLKEKFRFMKQLRVGKMPTEIRIKKWRDASGEVLKTKFLFLD